jgi:LmbE family N-acetylglucosaminyl deacetylase
MLRLPLTGGERRAERVLCLGAHCDDIEIGCGGTLLRLAEEGLAEACWVIFSSDPERAEEARAGAEVFLAGAGVRNVVIHSFRDGHLPLAWGEAKAACERIKREFSPDLVFTHYRNDLHQDHRVVSELTWNTFRDHLVLEYEIPKYDGDLGNPNFFVCLDEERARRKARGILSCYRSQAGKAWMDEQAFLALMRLRGVECNAPGRYAEGFHCRKISF